MSDASERISGILARSTELREQNRYAEHEALMRGAVERFPSDPEICLRAAASFMADDRRTATDLLRRVGEVAPRDPWKLARAASLMIELMEVDAAESLALRARRLAPADFVFAPDLDHVLGHVARYRGEHEEAERLLTAAFEALPGEAGHGMWLAQFFYEQVRPVRALEVLSEALRHRPDDPELHELREEVLTYIRTHGANVSDASEPEDPRAE